MGSAPHPPNTSPGISRGDITLPWSPTGQSVRTVVNELLIKVLAPGMGPLWPGRSNDPAFFCSSGPGGGFCGSLLEEGELAPAYRELR